MNEHIRNSPPSNINQEWVGVWCPERTEVAPVETPQPVDMAEVARLKAFLMLNGQAFASAQAYDICAILSFYHRFALLPPTLNQRYDLQSLMEYCDTNVKLYEGDKSGKFKQIKKVIQNFWLITKTQK